MVNPTLNVSLNDLRLIGEHRNISDYEKKSAKDLIKALRGSKPKLGIKKNTLKKIKEDFYNLRHKFAKKMQISIENFFYDIKNYRHLSEIEIKEMRKKFNKLEKSLNFKKPQNNNDNIHYEDLDKDEDPDGEDADDDKYRKTGSVRRLFKKSNRDYYKPTIIDRGFAGEVNNYIKHRSEGDEDEKLSPEEYLNMIRPDLRDSINRHKPIEELNNNNNNNTDTNNNNNNDNTDTNNNTDNTDREEWKIQLSIIISCISTKSFNEKRTMRSKSKAVEVFMGSENVIDTLFITLLQNFQSAQETSNERGREFIPESVDVLYYQFHKIDIIRAESYTISPDWIARKKSNNKSKK